MEWGQSSGKTDPIPPSPCGPAFDRGRRSRPATHHPLPDRSFQPL